MRSRIVLAFTTALIAASLCFGTATAANSNSKFRNCPNDFVLDLQSNWASPSDKNNDGWICVWYSPLPDQAVPGDYILIDNTAH